MMAKVRSAGPGEGGGRAAREPHFARTGGDDGQTAGRGAADLGGGARRAGRLRIRCNDRVIDHGFDHGSDHGSDHGGLSSGGRRCLRVDEHRRLYRVVLHPVHGTYRIECAGVHDVRGHA